MRDYGCRLRGLTGRNRGVTTRTKKPKPTDTFHRVLRGGSWYFSSATDVRAAFRVVSTPTIRSGSIGFRTAQSGCCQALPAQK